MKQKILFYGNCHLAVISKLFRNSKLSEKFDVQLASECGLHSFRDDGVFAVWAPPNKQKQETFKECIHSKIQESDIFVFQHHEGSVIEELKTKYLHDNIATGLKICVPETRLYVNVSSHQCLEPYIKYIKTKVNSEEEIMNYLKTSEDPELVSILKNDYPFNTSYQLKRNENRHRYEQNLKLYDNVINMCEFMEREFKNKILALTHAHPSEFYYIELINKLFNLLNLHSSDYPIENLEYLGAHGLDPRQFNFFTKTFPSLDYGSCKGRSIESWEVRQEEEPNRIM